MCLPINCWACSRWFCLQAHPQVTLFNLLGLWHPGSSPLTSMEYPGVSFLSPRSPHSWKSLCASLCEPLELVKLQMTSSMMSSIVQTFYFMWTMVRRGDTVVVSGRANALHADGPAFSPWDRQVRLAKDPAGNSEQLVQRILMAWYYQEPVLVGHAFPWHVLLQKCCKVLCSRARPRPASRATQAHCSRLLQHGGERGQRVGWMGWGRVEWGRDGVGMGGSGRGGGQDWWRWYMPNSRALPISSAHTDQWGPTPVILQAHVWVEHRAYRRARG